MFCKWDNFFISLTVSHHPGWDTFLDSHSWLRINVRARSLQISFLLLQVGWSLRKLGFLSNICKLLAFLLFFSHFLFVLSWNILFHFFMKSQHNVNAHEIKSQFLNTSILGYFVCVFFALQLYDFTTCSPGFLQMPFEFLSLKYISSILINSLNEIPPKMHISQAFTAFPFQTSSLVLVIITRG